jgi:ribose transport system ATP-binding protein
MSQDSSGIRVSDVAKSFDGVAALRGVSLVMRPGSVHALIGENGAGKSTLIKVITGVHRPDTGTVAVDGREVVFHGPQDALRAGVSAVHQERNLVPEFSVAENVFLHTPPVRAGFLRYGRLYDDAVPWLNRVGLDLDPRQPARELSVGQAQLVEVARALARKTKILLLDEPTASLTEHDTVKLFKLVRTLRDQGAAILFVSHKLHEVFDVCDRITVLRDGRTILDDVAASELTHDDVITAMVGREIALTRHTARSDVPEGPAVVELRGVSTSHGHKNIDLELGAGTVVGLYGLVGAGRTELAKALVGLVKIEGGEVLVRQQPVQIRNPYEALRSHGIGYVSEDRKAEGVILSHSIAKNVGITVWDRISRRFGFITPKLENESVAPVLARMGVKHTNVQQNVMELSGGNQQKVSVAKWLASDVDVLIIDEPTIGVDVRTKEDMYSLIEEVAAAGKAVVVISSDLEEIVRISDRILVMANKRFVLELHNTGDYDVLSAQIFQAIVGAGGVVTDQVPISEASASALEDSALVDGADRAKQGA